MKVLIACEFSGVVRRAFRELGHEAWSCDILPSLDDSPFHLQDDVRNLDLSVYDLLIGHPDCTFLANSGVRWLWHRDKTKNTRRWESMKDAADFFLYLWNAPVKRICLENPVMHKYGKELIKLEQSQVIQPWMFGHTETKATCLWLKNLPLLVPTNNVKEEMLKLPYSERARIHMMPPGPKRHLQRSITFEGVAKAMAEQWGILPV